ncbi:MAG: STAS domain-containing protein [Candidatus Rokubacteria bacterium]|nr:STAS domain-containing protein [Candidatus Rokubacteria bacterium]
MPTNRAAVVVPDGDLNAASGAELKRALEDLLAKGNTRLVVDMERVAYVDSVVWGELAMAAVRARGAGGELRVCEMCGELLAILTMIRLGGVIAVFHTRKLATVFS